MKKTALPLIKLLLILSVFFTACQKEESELIIEPDDGTITVSSDVTALLLRTAENNGSIDDLIDGFSCGSIVLPVTVFANGQKVTITTEDDLALIVAIFDQFPNDTDVIEIVFPVEIILDDYSQVTVNSQAELNVLIASCDNLGDDSIDCVDFVYPITLYVYDSELQQIDTVIIESAEEFYQFLSDLNENEFFGIDFPVSVIVNGEVIEVNSNQELEDIISNSNCDDGDNPIDNSQFIEHLTTGVWYVTYYFDDYDETGDFEGYEFTFNADKSAQTTNGSITIPGNWDVLGSTAPKLDLFFGTSNPMDGLDDDWDILEGTSEIIRLKDVSGGDGSTDYLTFGRTPNGGGSNGDVNALIEQLTTGVWYISLYNDDGDDETCDYVDYEFTYFANGSATAVSSSIAKNGFWTVVADSEGGLDLVLNFEYTGDNDPFEDLNDDWDVEEFSPTYINLKDVSGGNGGTDYLNFGRYPYSGCGGGGSAQELRDIMVDGLWYVHTYLDDGYNETSDYNGYTLNFYAAGNVTASNGSSTLNGTWEITESSGELDFVLDFGSSMPFDEFNDDWDVLAYTSTRVELEDVSGGGGGTDTLIFEKL